MLVWLENDVISGDNKHFLHIIFIRKEHALFSCGGCLPRVFFLLDLLDSEGLKNRSVDLIDLCMVDSFWVVGIPGFFVEDI